ncbi:hypothetical protein CIB84_000781 [Bambusicola thoracicus]|uniref:Uncharacterized protein n=1 Tax=Bambusicola thoracicus TaxID=9083 RepID=A0A2P4TGK6_BAMTH|nr:hypothetical protein CIB84_000781 [Bambusicola thoracicus]
MGDAKTQWVCLSFNLQSTLVATGSMDTTAKLWDVEKGEVVFTLRGHSAEIVALSFNTTGDRIITGSFDCTVGVWDVVTGRMLHVLIGHRGEISSAQFNWDCSLIATGSMDKTCMLWNATTGAHIATLTGHSDEIMDVCFDYAGQRIATASADGNRILTASSDKTARLWDAATGHCLQTLEGHTDEIFSCAFNYKGNIIITGSWSIELLSESSMLCNTAKQFPQNVFITRKQG